MPPTPEEMAYPTMLKQHPQLNDLHKMPLGQAVCVAAYSAHLMLDLIWLREIVYPFFYLPKTLGTRQERELIHFILLTYLDNIALDALPQTTVSTLAVANSNQWLPFIDDAILNQWQKMLVDQLQPGVTIRTAEIYAGRLGMSAVEFNTNLLNPNWMQTQLFAKIPVDKVQMILQTAVPQSLDLITNYLKEKYN